VAADLKREKEVWLNSGPLFQAIRASISIPLFFKPAEVNGDKLVDGGVLNPVPIAPTVYDDSDMIIAVNLGGKPDPDYHRPKKHEKSREEDDFAKKISDWIKGIDIARKVSEAKQTGMLEIAALTFETMQGAIARQRLAAYPPDVELQVPRNVCLALEFDRADEMIKLGYQLAEEKLSGLQRKQ
jgi:NTE family protein